MGSGVPEGWEQAIAARIARDFGHAVRLAPSPDAFQSQAGSMIDVFIDGELTGGLEVTWDDATPLSAVLSDLLGRVEELCAEELRSGR